MQKLSKKEMKTLFGGGDMGTGGFSACTATVIEYRTGDQFETPWNIKRQGACVVGANTADGAARVVSCNC